MARKTLDNSPKFEKSKNYAIGCLMNGASVTEVPEHFSPKWKPLYLSGTDLIGSGMKSCRDFLTSKNCVFNGGIPVQFYEVEYGAEGDKPEYKNMALLI